jgi:hypothetical protein
MTSYDQCCPNKKKSDFHWGFCYEIFEAKDFASLAMEFWLEDKRLEA